MKDTPNIDPNKSSSIGHKVEFWAGVVVGYEHQRINYHLVLVGDIRFVLSEKFGCRSGR